MIDHRLQHSACTRLRSSQFHSCFDLQRSQTQYLDSIGDEIDGESPGKYGPTSRKHLDPTVGSRGRRCVLPIPGRYPRASGKLLLRSKGYWDLTQCRNGAKKLTSFALCPESGDWSKSMASSMLTNTMSISDDDLEDPPNRIRSRNRRKRRKPGPRGRPDFTRKILLKVLVWWPAMLLIAAIALLAYEYVKIGGGESQAPPQVQNSVNIGNQKIKAKPLGNLNRLDPITRVVRGVREPCLKLLPPDELEQLDIPNDMDSSSPVKALVFSTETDRVSEGKLNLSVYANGSRFNLFTGNQTLEQREESFKVAERAEVHCGFYSERGGFRISAEDKSYMDTCKVVVSTCAFGGGDDLYQPIGMSETSRQKVCYVAFWDEITLSVQEAEGNKVDDNHFIGKWRIVIVRDLPFTDQRLNGKIPKMLPHRLFPNARYSIWVDSKSQFRRDPLGVLESLLWRSSDELAISEHGARSSVYDEAKAVVKKNKATPEEVEVQITQYDKDGLPKDKRFNGKKALSEASIIVRKHTPMTNLLMCLWFNEVVRFTSRDQLSFPYVLWRLNEFNRINMFPVCTRKDLVNSMGHIRKAKPLTN